VTFPPLPQPIKAGTRFSDPRGMQGWVDLVGLVIYWGGIPAQRRSPIPALTGLNVEQLRSCDERRYRSAKPPYLLLIYRPKRMTGWVGSPVVVGLVIIVISCRSHAGQGKFAGQRPTFYYCAMQPTTSILVHTNATATKAERPKSFNTILSFPQSRVSICSTISI